MLLHISSLQSCTPGVSYTGKYRTNQMQPKSNLTGTHRSYSNLLASIYVFLALYLQIISVYLCMSKSLSIKLSAFMKDFNRGNELHCTCSLK